MQSEPQGRGSLALHAPGSHWLRRGGQLLLALGLLAALLFSIALHTEQQRQAGLRYAREVAIAATALEDALTNQEANLQQLHDLFAVADGVAPRQFKQVVQALRERYPEIMQAGWIEVPDPAALQRRLQGAELSAGAAALAPLTFAEPYYPGQLIEWDLAGPPVDLRGALAAALEQGLVALPPIRSPTLPDEPVCLILLMPVFRTPEPPPEQRLEQLRGFLTLTVFAEPLLRRTLQPLLATSRLDLVAASELGGMPLGYTPVVELLRHPAGEWRFDPEQTVQMTLRGSGRHWLLRAEPLAASAAVPLHPWLMLALQLLLCALLALHLRRGHQREGELDREVLKREAELAEARLALVRLADTDPLTGLPDRSRFDDELARNWRRAQRNREPLGLLLIDIDHLRELNEASGHAAADEALKAVARVLARCAERPGDLLSRVNGDRFALLLPGCGCGVEAVAQRCRQAVIDLLIPHPHSTTAGVVTVSVGATWLVPQAGPVTASLLLERAGEALARAKAAGRNRVEVSADG